MMRTKEAVTERQEKAARIALECKEAVQHPLWDRACAIIGGLWGLALSLAYIDGVASQLLVMLFAGGVGVVVGMAVAMLGLELCQRRLADLEEICPEVLRAAEYEREQLRWARLRRAYKRRARARRRRMIRAGLLEESPVQGGGS